MSAHLLRPHSKSSLPESSSLTCLLPRPTGSMGMSPAILSLFLPISGSQVHPVLPSIPPLASPSPQRPHWMAHCCPSQGTPRLVWETHLLTPQAIPFPLPATWGPHMLAALRDLAAPQVGRGLTTQPVPPSQGPVAVCLSLWLTSGGGRGSLLSPVTPVNAHWVWLGAIADTESLQGSPWPCPQV